MKLKLKSKNLVKINNKYNQKNLVSIKKLLSKSKNIAKMFSKKLSKIRLCNNKFKLL